MPNYNHNLLILWILPQSKNGNRYLYSINLHAFSGIYTGIHKSFFYNS
jgi:hypothetical protein